MMLRSEFKDLSSRPDSISVKLTGKHLSSPLLCKTEIIASILVVEEYTVHTGRYY